MYQRMTKLLLAGVVAALCAVIGTPAALAQTVSGCLTTDGKLKSFVLGGDPVACPGTQIPVTLGAAGADGADGADGTNGTDGTDGAAGADGNAAQFALVTVGTPTNGVITEDEWDECANTVGGRPANSFDALTLPWATSSTNLFGWVNPYIVAHSTGDVVVDISGVVGDGGKMVCRLTPTAGPWTASSVSSNGLVAFRGTVFADLCNVMHRVVCVQAVGP